MFEDRPQIVLQGLDLFVVGRHPVAHQAVRARQSVQDVDAHPGVLLDEALGGVDPARPRTYDGDMQHGGTPCFGGGR
ncbi:hypothetical protein SAV14893_006060 [Streptomyces avermitilis]|nr:hypothetical protein SAVMC3_18040 [Streptomyces avermitilis]GDY61213.1 hypothetical protein SAV14893_006060 [Streptomyces avermitilis]GDY87526.1 hypothetical protein SAVCW2_67250 [Streptomyces avermitilis]